MNKEVFMAQIFEMTKNQSKEFINLNIKENDFDFLKARQLAKETKLFLFTS